MERTNEKREGRLQRIRSAVALGRMWVSVIPGSVLRIYYSGLLIEMGVKDVYCITGGSVGEHDWLMCH